MLDDLCHRLEGGPLARFRTAVAVSGRGPSAIIGYKVGGKAPTGRAIGDLGHVTTAAPYPDPFRGR